MCSWRRVCLQRRASQDASRLEQLRTTAHAFGAWRCTLLSSRWAGAMETASEEASRLEQLRATAHAFGAWRCTLIGSRWAGAIERATEEASRLEQLRATAHAFGAWRCTLIGSRWAGAIERATEESQKDLQAAQVRGEAHLLLSRSCAAWHCASRAAKHEALQMLSKAFVAWHQALWAACQRQRSLRLTARGAAVAGWTVAFCCLAAWRGEVLAYKGSLTKKAISGWRSLREAKRVAKSVTNVLGRCNAWLLARLAMAAWQQVRTLSRWQAAAEATSKQVTTALFLRAAQVSDQILQQSSEELLLVSCTRGWAHVSTEARWERSFSLRLRDLSTRQRAHNVEAFSSIASRVCVRGLLSHVLSSWASLASHRAKFLQVISGVIAQRTDIEQQRLLSDALSAWLKVKCVTTVAQSASLVLARAHARQLAVKVLSTWCRAIEAFRAACASRAAAEALSRGCLRALMTDVLRAWCRTSEQLDFLQALQAQATHVRSLERERADAAQACQQEVALLAADLRCCEILCSSSGAPVEALAPVAVVPAPAPGLTRLLVAGVVAAWRRLSEVSRWEAGIQVARLLALEENTERILEERWLLAEALRTSKLRLHLVRLLGAWLRLCQQQRPGLRGGLDLCHVKEHDVWRYDRRDLAAAAHARLVLAARHEVQAAVRHDAKLEALSKELARRGATRSCLVELGLGSGYTDSRASQRFSKCLEGCLSQQSLAAVFAAWRVCAVCTAQRIADSLQAASAARQLARLTSRTHTRLLASHCFFVWLRAALQREKACQASDHKERLERRERRCLLATCFAIWIACCRGVQITALRRRADELDAKQCITQHTSELLENAR
eukprot:TRINITY_DN16205_c0_g1_i1.p1 TRINITY_DN16205_c0_g1~~TRINITY_DN16205_c0_g1_i1.p1  ORF type:complete len:884 (-),score=171.39 TRINITY_DN16205_c0_g1_i1:64-2592(-)